MAQTLYAAFPTAIQGEQAAGALLDYGANKDDITLVISESYRLGNSTVVGSPVADVGYRGGELRSGGAVLDRPDMVDRAVDIESDEYIDRTDEIAMADRTATPFVGTSEYVVESDRTSSPDIDGAAKQGISVTTPQDAGAGAAKGAGWGLGVGVLAGLASLMIPGVGLVVGGGALATAIAGAIGATVAGGIAGGVTGYLKDQGVPAEVAADYSSAVQQGGAMLAILTPSNDVDSVLAQQVMEKYGATKVDVY